MATRFEAFCNTTTDLQAVLAGVDNYDRKRLLRPNWQTTGVSNLYKLSDSGYISQLYINSVEATAVGDTPNADNEYAYDSASDSVTFFLASSSTSALNGSSFEASEDWATLKQKVVNEQADRIRSYINRPIYKRKKDTSQGASERQYDFVLIRSNAILAVADLIRSVDPEKAAEIESQVFDLEAGQGLMDKLKRGEYTLWNEAS